MTQQMKKYLIANWKMNGDLVSSECLASEYSAKLRHDIDIIIAAPFPYLFPLKNVLKGSSVCLCAQNCSMFKNGAYTGEVSASMLQDLEIPYVLVGHSERRQYHHEQDEQIKQKVLRAIECNIKSILCVGESLADRNNQQHLNIISEQLKWLEQENIPELIIAYEPIWAIGTGLVPNNQQIEEMIEHIKAITKRRIPVLYGGSVNAANIAILSQLQNCDGFLVGGSSLKIEEIVAINHHLIKVL